MRIALYIEDGLEQVVLTPESETEKGILGKLHDGSREMSLKRGTFYGCRGGWTRHRDVRPNHFHMPDDGADDSTMIVLTVPTQKEPAPPELDLMRLADLAHDAALSVPLGLVGHSTPSGPHNATVLRNDIADAVHRAILKSVPQP